VDNVDLELCMCEQHLERGSVEEALQGFPDRPTVRTTTAVR
jgi:hypothetical protein